MIKDSSNMATAFISWGTIGEVYAWNGTASYLIGIDEHIGFFNINYTIEHSFDIEKELYVDSLIMLGKVMVYSVLGSKNGVENSLETYFGEVADLSELGKMRYYINDEGRIAYEKVPNISWSITHALYSS